MSHASAPAASVPHVAPRSDVLRQIHLDFHSSHLIPGLGADFDGEAFGGTLAAAHVNSVLCFARCHHGWVYYDSELLADRRHPTMGPALLPAQIEACHRHGIKVPIYTTVQWDDGCVQTHPEWRVVHADGSLEGTPPFEPGFYRKLCLNSGFRQFIRDHTVEILQMLGPVDGMYFDFIRADSCVCVNCQRLMRAQGVDPSDPVQVARFGVQTVNAFELEHSELVRSIQPDCPITYNGGHIGVRHRDAAPAYTHFELETLPSGGWGYLYFPVNGRYARTLGPAIVGTTGKFHGSWGDFGSVKNQAALEYEVFRLLAHGAGCSIGDQLHPRGVLESQTYDLVGQVYGQVEAKQPWCVGAQPQVDIAVFNAEEQLGGGVMDLPPGVQGVTRMLIECGHQFDIIDSHADLSRYRLLVLPDHIRLTATLAERIDAYLAAGGAVLASFESGLASDRDEFVVPRWGVQVVSAGPRDAEGRLARGRVYKRADFAEYLRVVPALGSDLPVAEQPMYIRGMDVAVREGADTVVLGRIVRSYFDRRWDHYMSHAQAPPSGQEAGVGISACGRVVYFSNPICTQYETNAPLWVKRMFRAAINRLLPDPLIRHDGPSSVEVSVLDQARPDQPAPDRRIVHVLHYVPERRGQAFDIIEDVLPVRDLTVDVRVDRPISSVTLVPGGTALAFEQSASGPGVGRVRVTVPEVRGHAMLALA